MAISEEENEESAENSLEEKTQRAAKQAVRQLVIGLVDTAAVGALCCWLDQSGKFSSGDHRACDEGAGESYSGFRSQN